MKVIMAGKVRKRLKKRPLTTYCINCTQLHTTVHNVMLHQLYTT
jgi:hypothetical protein